METSAGIITVQIEKIIYYGGWLPKRKSQSLCFYSLKFSAESEVIPFFTLGSGIGLSLNGYKLTLPMVTGSERPPMVISSP